MLNLPEPDCLPNTDVLVPYHFIGDDAFPLQEHIMKPFAHRFLDHREAIYNYRLSRARRTVENVFGIMASRFRVLHTQINLLQKTTRRVVTSVAILHNILNLRNKSAYLPTGSIDQEDGNFGVVPGEWRTQGTLDDIRPSRSRNPRDVAKLQRETICDYFSSARGAVPWQENLVRANYGPH